MSITDTVLSQAVTVWNSTETVLSAHDFSAGPVSFEDVVNAVTTALGVTDKRSVREVDSQVRYFVRHSDHYVSRTGVGGGINLASMIKTKTKANTKVKVTPAVKAQVAQELEDMMNSPAEMSESNEEEESEDA
jgi:hypothetical protein